MKRTTISLPDDVALAMQREARRTHASASQVARDALRAHLGIGRARELPFAALGHSGHSSTARDIEALLEHEWVSILAIVDAGPLYAAADIDDRDHEACVQALAREDLRLVVPALVIAEATYFVGRRLGAAAEAAFLCGLHGLDIEGPSGEDFARMAELVDQYADFPLGGTDASVIALAERAKATVIVTLDHRHFRTITPRHRDTFELLP